MSIYFLVDVIKSDSLLVCWVCKLIMQGGPEELDEHMVKDHEFDDAPNRYIFNKLLYSYLLYNLKMLII